MFYCQSRHKKQVAKIGPAYCMHGLKVNKSSFRSKISGLVLVDLMHEAVNQFTQDLAFARGTGVYSF